MAEGVQVAGLKEFVRELRKADRELPKAIRQANLDVAKEVAEGTRASFSSRGGVAPKVASSVRALAQQARAQVGIGGARYPYALGSEFGSVRYKQFPPWRGSGPGAGYSLYPTIRSMRDEISQKYLDRIADATSGAFPS